MWKKAAVMTMPTRRANCFCTNGSEWEAASSKFYCSCNFLSFRGTRWPSGTRLDFAIARSRVRLPPVAAVYQRLLSVPSLQGRLISSSLRGEGLVRLIGIVVCLLCCAAGPLVRYRGQLMAAYRATVSSAHTNQLPLPGL